MNPGFTSLFNCSFKCEVADNHFAFYNFQKRIPCNWDYPEPSSFLIPAFSQRLIKVTITIIMIMITVITRIPSSIWWSLWVRRPVCKSTVMITMMSLMSTVTTWMMMKITLKKMKNTTTTLMMRRMTTLRRMPEMEKQVLNMPTFSRFQCNNQEAFSNCPGATFIVSSCHVLMSSIQDPPTPAPSPSNIRRSPPASSCSAAQTPKPV